MPTVAFIIKGIVIGFLIAVPVGPVGLLCIQRTLYRGRLAGFASGLGAALADTVYGAIAALGLTVISDFLIAHRVTLSVGGCLVLLALSWRIWHAKPHDHKPLPIDEPRLLAYLTTSFAITITNPLTIVAFMICFTAFGILHASTGIAMPLAITCGVFCGASIWWFCLVSMAHGARQWLAKHRLRYLNRISAVLIAACGVVALAMALVKKPPAAPGLHDQQTKTVLDEQGSGSSNRPAL